MKKMISACLFIAAALALFAASGCALRGDTEPDPVKDWRTHKPLWDPVTGEYLHETVPRDSSRRVIRPGKQE